MEAYSKKVLALPSLLLAFATGAFAQSGQTPPGGIKGQPGEPVVPIEVYMKDMARVVGLYAGPVHVIPRGEVPGGNAAFQEWKKNQPPVHVDHNVTIDPSAALALSPQAPSVGVGFEGITQQGYIPGEPQPAVGPKDIFVIGNVSVVIANKDGSNRREILQSDFFSIPSSEGAGFDAKCFFDALHKRFVVLTETQGKSQGIQWSNYYLAISQTDSAGAGWYILKFDMTKDGTTQTSNWSDFPGLGISDDKLVMSGQQFSFGGNLYQYQKLRVIDRAAAYDGSATGYVDFADFPAPPGGNVANLFVTKPGRNKSPGATIHVFTVRYSGGSNVAYRTITGSPSSPELSAGTLISVNTYGAAADAKQLGHESARWWRLPDSRFLRTEWSSHGCLALWKQLW